MSAADRLTVTFQKALSVAMYIGLSINGLGSYLVQGESGARYVTCGLIFVGYIFTLLYDFSSVPKQKHAILAVLFLALSSLSLIFIEQ